MSTYSILMPFAPARPEQALAIGAFAQWSSAYRLWQGQATTHEPYQTFNYLAASGFRVPVGFGVTLMPFRHPYEAALQAQSLAISMGHPVVAGFGPGARVLQQAMLGAPYRSQLGAVREYATAVRGMLNGEKVPDGEYFICRTELVQLPRPPVEVGLGVLRPGMARLAGEVADVAITWLTPAAYLRDTIVPALRAGAEAAGRPMPRLAAIVPLALDRPDREAVEFALASNSGHLQLPHYVDMLRRSGIETDPADPGAGARALIEGRAFLSGGPEAVAEQLAEYVEAGVDEIVLNVIGVCTLLGLPTALRELESVLAVVDT
ncbi:MAG TPA: LLM class flavin-dependent oxidoreductase [Micromonospora sp.]|nr:LLM class flavin-dependent oxidoreductase [Micromonospora sp.]